jgi:hypothetical protein
MSRRLFEGSKAGLDGAPADIRGEPGRVVKVTTIAPVESKRRRGNAKLREADSPSHGRARHRKG